jgi:2-C-methyl-D-erythritol 4-phosphate cytidylyltransferase
MGGTLPKQFMLLKDRPVLYYTLKAFLDAYDDLHVILVLPVDHKTAGEEIVHGYFDKTRVSITTGGDTRFQSVKNGLALVENESIIFVHDAVRCLVSKELIHCCYKQAHKTGTSVPVISSKDSIRLLQGEKSEAFDRNNVMLVQTPQVFQSKILLPAYQTDFKEEFTDEATVVEASGIQVSLVDGEENNIKITRPVDLLIAGRILEERAHGS